MKRVALNELINAKKDEASVFFKKLFDDWNTVDLIEEEPARSLVKSLYRNMGLNEPLVFFCDSPWTVCSLILGLSDLSYGERRIEEFSKSEFLENYHRQWWQTTESFCKENDIVHAFSRLKMTKSDLGSNFVSPLAISKNLATQVNTESDRLVEEVFDQLFLDRRKIDELLRGTKFNEFSPANHLRNVFEFSFADAIFSILNHVYAYALKSQDELMVFVEKSFEREQNLRELYLQSYLRKNIYNAIVANIVDSVARGKDPDFHTIATRIVNAERVLPVFSGFELIHPLAVHAFILQLAPGEIFGKKTEERLKFWIELGKSSYGFAFFVGVCFVIRRPIRVELSGLEFHDEEKAALEFLDGYRQFYIQGRRVPQVVVEEPEKINIKLIYSEQNAEVRRIMIERFGLLRFLEESGAEAIHEDETGVLYSKRLQWESEPIVAVLVNNATAEPDGSFRKYILRVPPHMRTAREAVAWTFHMDEKDYKPDVES